MFCPKCGMNNPETGKFCRSCGTDLSNVSDALSGKKSGKSQSFGMFPPIQPLQPMNLWDGKDKPPSWESALGKIFMGVGFLVVAMILGATGAGNASKWWFWMLLPAFAMLGSGIAQYVQLKKYEQKAILSSEPETPRSFSQNSNASLPPSQTEYVAPDSRYKTGELVPPSVVEGTTRHLEINSEGETMTLPKK